MNEIVNKINDVLGPAGSTALGHALIGLSILVIGLFVVKLIVGFLEKPLSKIKGLKPHNKNGTATNFLPPILSLIKGVLSILVLMAVLEHFGLTNVLEPLQEMVNKFMTAIPNIIGAGVIAYAGWIIAKIVSEVSEVALGKFDKQLEKRTGNQEIRVSKLCSALIFAIVFLPIAVSALGVLNIPAITVPASLMIEKLMAAVPNIVGAGIVLLVSYLAARFTIYILSNILNGMNINSLPKKIGATALFTDKFTPICLISASIMFFSMVAASTAAVNILGIEVISEVFSGILHFGGGILVGGLILLIGNFLSAIAHKKLSENGNSAIANIARIAILGLVLAMGLKAMGLADNIVTMAFGFTIGSVAIACALAFGLGGKDAAKKVSDRWAEKIIN